VSLNDLRQYRAIVYENEYLIRLDEQYRMYMPPPPSSGILVAFIMKLMKGLYYIIFLNMYIYIRGKYVILIVIRLQCDK
jgi:hypothetical protein